MPALFHWFRLHWHLLLDALNIGQNFEGTNFDLELGQLFDQVLDVDGVAGYLHLGVSYLAHGCVYCSRVDFIRIGQGCEFLLHHFESRLNL